MHKSKVDRFVADQIALCAINTGTLYRMHRELADPANGFKLFNWTHHVKHVVIPHIRADYPEASDANFATRLNAAIQLKRYYDDHHRECATCVAAA